MPLSCFYYNYLLVWLLSSSIFYNLLTSDPSLVTQCDKVLMNKNSENENKLIFLEETKKAELYSCIYFILNETLTYITLTF